VDPIEQFFQECDERVAGNAGSALAKDAAVFLESSIKSMYSYNFTWLGRPIIQYPQDIVAMQELIWKTQPDLIIETGIAHGGSLILNASILAMMDYAEAAKAGTTLDPKAVHRQVLGLDIDIRTHNRAAIEGHPLAHILQSASQRRGRDIEAAAVVFDHDHEARVGELHPRRDLCRAGMFDRVVKRLLHREGDVVANLAGDSALARDLAGMHSAANPRRFLVAQRTCGQPITEEKGHAAAPLCCSGRRRQIVS